MLIPLNKEHTTSHSETECLYLLTKSIQPPTPRHNCVHSRCLVVVKVHQQPASPKRHVHSEPSRHWRSARRSTTSVAAPEILIHEGPVAYPVRVDPLGSDGARQSVGVLITVLAAIATRQSLHFAVVRSGIRVSGLAAARERVGDGLDRPVSRVAFVPRYSPCHRYAWIPA